jgi:hypothetical protein
LFTGVTSAASLVWYVAVKGPEQEEMTSMMTLERESHAAPKTELSPSKATERLWLWASLLIVALSVAAFGIGIATPPRSGPFARATASTIHTRTLPPLLRDFLWMYPALLVPLVFIVFLAAFASLRHAPSAPTTSVSAHRASGTIRPSSASPDAASMCSTPCSANAPRIVPGCSTECRLTRKIGAPPAIERSHSARGWAGRPGLRSRTSP